MGRSMDPFSGSYSMTDEVRIPSWEIGERLPHYDSSDLSGISSSSSDEDDTSSFEGVSLEYGNDGAAQTAEVPANLLAELERTPKASSKTHTTSRRRSETGSISKSAGGDMKGKGKAKDQDESELSTHPEPPKSGSSVKSSTRPRRPRSHSNASSSVASSSSPSSSSPAFATTTSPPATSASADAGHYRITSKRAPGPAAQAMADFMSGGATGSSTTTTRTTREYGLSSSFSGPSRLLPATSLGPLANTSTIPTLGLGSGPLKFNSKPLSRPLNLIKNSNRQLGRASSAPTNLFSESAPTGNLFFSPGKIDEQGTGGGGIGCPASPEPDLHAIFNKAYEARSGSIDLSHKNLLRISDNIIDLSHFVSHDVRTGNSHPTPIYLNLSHNYINASGLSPSLFAISNLKILDLRANQIETLPQSIGNLKGLKELLLFNNKLKYLPAEILDLKLEKLVLGSNRFFTYQKIQQPSSARLQNNKKQDVMSKVAADSATAPIEEQEKLDTAIKRVCEPRKQNFRVPTLLELCTRRLLEPVNSNLRDSTSPTVMKSAKLFTPGMNGSSNGRSVRRNFHVEKDKIISSDSSLIPIATHLLKPFIPLLHPLPHNLRILLSPSHSPSGTTVASIQNTNRVLASPARSSTSDTAVISSSQLAASELINDIQQCSTCKTACHEFAETRIEWRNEIAGVRLGKSDDERCWVPVLWKGCSANCLDFLDE